MAQALLHREQDIGVAAGLDMDDPIGVKPGELERGREQIAPAQAPEYGTVDPREDAGEEDGGAGVVGKIGAAGDFVKRAGGQAAAGQVAVDRVEFERKGRMANAHAFDPRDPRA